VSFFSFLFSGKTDDHNTYDDVFADAIQGVADELKEWAEMEYDDDDDDDDDENN
jgi:hypothetical protein